MPKLIALLFYCVKVVPSFPSFMIFSVHAANLQDSVPI